MSKETVVLIVDDELELERHLKRKAEKFKEKKLRFVFVDSGIEAVEYLSVNKPDIIFLDIILPPSDGYSICKVIKSNPDTQNIPVILMSGKLPAEMKRNYKSVGADDYLVKPFKISELLGKIEIHSMISDDFDPEFFRPLGYGGEDEGEKVSFSVEELGKLFEDIESEFISEVDRQRLENNLRVKVSEDRMEATLILYPVIDLELYKVETENIMDFLRRRGITFGILEDEIGRNLKKFKETNSRIEFVVARGKKVVDGTDTEIILNFDRENCFDPGNMGGNRKLVSVKEGEHLGRIKGHSIGVDGMDVFGNAVPARIGRKLNIKFGDGIRVEEDGNLYSRTDGVLKVTDNFYDVCESLEIDSDVGIGTGNIEFDGNVVIRGNVQRGYYVKASGDVVVDGNVEGAEIGSGKNIYVRGGIVGTGDEIEIKSDGVVETKYIENAVVIARNKIVVREAIINSIVYCGGEVIVALGRGKIIGGTTYSTSFIKCIEAGNMGEVKTELVVGEDYMCRYKLNKLAERIGILSSEVQVVQTIVRGLKKKGVSRELIELMKTQPRIMNFIRNYVKLREELSLLMKHKFELEKKLNVGKYPRIYCIGKLNKNVLVSINGIRKLLMTSVENCRVFLEDEKIRVEKLDPSD